MTSAALKLDIALDAPQTAARRRNLRRRSMHQSLELAGVLALMGSSAACAVFTLLHLA